MHRQLRTKLTLMLVGCMAFFLAGCEVDPPIAPNVRLPVGGQNEMLGPQDLGESVEAIVFWTSSCEPAKLELAEAKTFQQNVSAKNLGVLAVLLEDTWSIEDSSYFNSNFPLFHAVYDRDGLMAKIYDVKNSPTTLILDANGRARNRWMGYHGKWKLSDFAGTQLTRLP
jgi:hypothetical protein